jgi:hypothetical protein
VAPSATTWLTTAELLASLRISRSTLQRCHGLFRAGVHYRWVNPKTKRGPRRWNLAAVNQALLLASRGGRG